MPTPPASTSSKYKAVLKKNIKGRSGMDKLPNSVYCTRSTTIKATNTTNPITRSGGKQQTGLKTKATNATNHNNQYSKKQQSETTRSTTIKATHITNTITPSDGKQQTGLIAKATHDTKQNTQCSENQQTEATATTLLTTITTPPGSQKNEKVVDTAKQDEVNIDDDADSKDGDSDIEDEVEYHIHGNDVDSDTDEEVEEDISMTDDTVKKPTTYFMNVMFTVSASNAILQDIRTKYKSLLSTLIEADDELVLLSADPMKPQPTISDPAKIPEKMTKLGKYFQSTSRPPKEDEGDIWATFRINAKEDLEDILQATDYDLRDENIVLMRKRLQCFKTSTPGYFQFIDNKVDPLDLFNQITEDIGRNCTWTIVIKKPWEGFQKKTKAKTKSKGYNREDFLAKTPHIECMVGDEDDLIQKIRRWIKRGRAELRFGPHVKYIEALTTLSHPQQVERTLRMNAYGKRFQSSIDMVELSGLNNPNGPYDEKHLTIRRRILDQRTAHDEHIFLSVTKKWGSSLWQATYITQRRNDAIDYAACPAAWLTHDEDEEFKAMVFKSFDPHAVQEARESTWDEENERIITPSEKEANDDEADAANIPWLMDLKHMDKDEDDAEVKFTSGVNFNFSEDVSVKTTRIHGEPKTYEQGTDEVSTPTNTRKPNISILRSPSDGCSVNSAITMDTRMTTLETTLDQILVFMKSTQSQSNTHTDNTSEATTQEVTTVIPPAPLKRGVGE